MNEAQLQLLADELADARYNGLTAGQASQKLFATVQEHTVTQPAPMNLGAMLEALSAESSAKLPDASIIEFSRAVVGPNKDGRGGREAVEFFLALWLKAGKINFGEYSACAAQLAATEIVTVSTPCDSRFAVAFAGVAGFPNTATDEEFASAWQLARG